MIFLIVWKILLITLLNTPPFSVASVILQISSSLFLSADQPRPLLWNKRKVYKEVPRAQTDSADIISSATEDWVGTADGISFSSKVHEKVPGHRPDTPLLDYWSLCDKADYFM